MASEEKQWYTKYRPKTIEEYHGEKIKNIVKRRFSSEEKRPNVVLAYGTSGCGKTTILRILAKYYMCLEPNEDGTPCEKCEMCQMINDRLINKEDGVECDGVMELDATKASKADMEDILEEAVIAPMFTKKKVLILDECHKLTDSTQSLLLKLLEDIPKHLVVMMATTNEEKMLDTILNRCQVKMEVHKQSVHEMAEVMLDIAKKENLTVSMNALELIARTENRVPRQCINTLEDVAKSFDGNVTVDNVTELCSVVKSELYLDFYKAANRGLEDILMFNMKLKSMDISIPKFVSGLMKFTMEAIYIKHGIALEEYTKSYVSDIKGIFKIYKSGDFDMLLQILEYAAKMLTNDENRNEVLLTTTAMRISKIDLLANGLTNERARAVDENAISLARHLQEVKESTTIVESDYEVDMSEENMLEEHSNLESVDCSEAYSSLFSMASSEIGDTEESSEISKDDEEITYDEIERIFAQD